MSSQPSSRHDFSSTPAPVKPGDGEWGGQGAGKAVAARESTSTAPVGPRVRRVLPTLADYYIIWHIYVKIWYHSTRTQYGRTHSRHRGTTYIPYGIRDADMACAKRSDADIASI